MRNPTEVINESLLRDLTKLNLQPDPGERILVQEVTYTHEEEGEVKAGEPKFYVDYRLNGSFCFNPASKDEVIELCRGREISPEKGKVVRTQNHGSETVYDIRYIK